ncbi:hypothetical protein [Bradyrhizobium sp. SZCCHNR1039]|uniref:hypothetical protein n=1 Tax=Bradyrhizobium sp. SZCCHNR1039 TaxID=3057350 RepID=UPI002917027E|nr:hypothetical protein [Bradyrhizobium sp. SZCCHNR1039]
MPTDIADVQEIGAEMVQKALPVASIILRLGRAEPKYILRDIGGTGERMVARPDISITPPVIKGPPTVGRGATDVETDPDI